jgi:hypothetical protein
MYKSGCHRYETTLFVHFRLCLQPSQAMIEDILARSTASFQQHAVASHEAFLTLAAESAEVFAACGTSRVSSSGAASSSSAAIGVPISAGNEQPTSPSPPVADEDRQPPPWRKKQRLVSPERPPPSSSTSAPSGYPPGMMESSSKYTPEQLMDVKAEAAVAMQLGLSWPERGPAGPSEESSTWRGQAWRQGSERWANRGGAKKEWFTAFYKAKRQGKDALAAFLAENPKP